jgi:hypothetical protein
VSALSRKKSVLRCGIGVALLVSCGTPAYAALGTYVIPANGKIAGRGYAYYLQRSWQIDFAVATNKPIRACNALTVNGQHVAVLDFRNAAGLATYKCIEPAGRPVYVTAVASDECSTFAGDHEFGTTNLGLERCARTGFGGTKQKAWVDGRTVNVDKLITATNVFPVRLAKNNVFHSTNRSGRAAAYGYGLLLSGFSTGTHVVHWVWSMGASMGGDTWILDVH